MEEDVVTQELAFPKLFVEASTQINTATTLMEEEVVTLSIHVRRLRHLVTR